MPRTRWTFTVTVVDTTAPVFVVPAAGETWTIILDDRPFSYRVLSTDNLASIALALANAIKHGNQMDPTKTVRIMFRAGYQKVRIEIEDQGGGFQPGDVPDPTADENLERPCGRGIMLMRAFMTSIEYNDSGNRVVLEPEDFYLLLSAEAVRVPPEYAAEMTA